MEIALCYTYYVLRSTFWLYFTCKLTYNVPRYTYNKSKMAHIKSFPNNPYQENTYILYDETGECAIIDPGMYTATEQNVVVNFIKNNNLKPVLLLNTHCHIDHVLGNKLVFDLYGLRPQFNEGEKETLEAVVAYAPAMGFTYEVSPLPDVYLP